MGSDNGVEEIKIEVSDEQILEYYKKGFSDERYGHTSTEPEDRVLMMAYHEGAFVCGFNRQYPNDTIEVTDESAVKTVKNNYIAEQEGYRAMMEGAKAEAEETERIINLLKEEKGEDWVNELKEYLEYEDCYFSPKIVDKPKGELQTVEDGELIKEEWVNQTTNGGYTGDDFAGTIYFKLSEGRYLEFGYTM
jgi:hypothetical protein